MTQVMHRYEGTVNQVMGDGIMTLFGAPIAHEDHAVWACYAALPMQETVMRYGDEMQCAEGHIQVQLLGLVAVRGLAVAGLDSAAPPVTGIFSNYPTSRSPRG
jgi:class 3 adenylate cyclase